MDNTLYGQLQHFHAIASAGSISEAARRLGLSVPAVSKSLKLLERNLGTPLFNRTTRRVSLTDEGRKLQARTASAMQMLEDAVMEALDDADRPLAGSVRITLSRFAFELIVQPVYAAFHRLHPGIELEISVNDGTVDLVEQGFDIGIRFSDRVDEGMIARRLLPPFREGLYVSAAYAERCGVPKTPAELARHRLIGYRFVTANRLLPLILDQNGTEIAIDMPVSLVCNDIGVMTDAIRQGFGIGRLFEPLRNRLVDAGDFLPVLPKYWRHYPPVSLYYLQGSRKSRKVQAVVDFLLQHVAADAGG